MVEKSNRYRVQWAAQFFAAAELTRKGYTVSFTLGNAPETDLHVSNPKTGKQFRVDVKGHGTKNFWEIRKRESKKDLFYILVDIFEESPNYCILSSKETMDEWNNYYEHIREVRRAKGTEFPKDYRWGITHTQAIKYEDKWGKLP